MYVSAIPLFTLLWQQETVDCVWDGVLHQLTHRLQIVHLLLNTQFIMTPGPSIKLCATESCHLVPLPHTQVMISYWLERWTWPELTRYHNSQCACIIFVQMHSSLIMRCFPMWENPIWLIHLIFLLNNQFNLNTLSIFSWNILGSFTSNLHSGLKMVALTTTLTDTEGLRVIYIII